LSQLHHQSLFDFFFFSSFFKHGLVADGMAQTESTFLPSKHEALSSNPNAKKRNGLILLPRAGLEPQSSHLCILNSWNYKYETASPECFRDSVSLSFAEAGAKP
jgi:hypothetical protein